MRTVLAVIAGYIAMFLLVIILFTIAYLAMGADLSFKPGSYEPSLLWIVVSFVLGLIAAIAGGWICAAIAPGTKAPVALVVVVIVLGLLTSIPAFIERDPASVPPRDSDVGSMEAMQNARTPVWVALLNPLVGAAGVFWGARLRRSRSAAAATD